MYAVIKTGGKQYRVASGAELKVESLVGDVGSTISFDEVLMVGVGESIKVGAPFVAGASVKAEVVKHGRGDKIARALLSVVADRERRADLERQERLAEQALGKKPARGAN